MPEAPKATIKDWWATVIHVFLVFSGIAFVVLVQNTWLMLFNLHDKNENVIIKKNAGTILRKVTRPLAEGAAPKDKQVDEAVVKKTSKALNGIVLMGGIYKRWILGANPYWHRIVEYDCDMATYNKKTYLFMGNHTSYADVFFTCGMGFNFATVGMSTLLSVPLGGTMLKNTGYLPVYFKKKPDGKWGTDVEKTKEMIQQSINYLETGLSLFIFPEGTINMDYELGEFKPGFFNVGRQTGVDVIPVAIHGASKVWPMAAKSTPRFPLSHGTVFIKVGSPMPQLKNETVSLMNSEEELKDFLHTEYKVEFGNGKAEEGFPAVFESLLSWNANERIGSEDYDKKVNELFRLVVRKRIFEMRLFLENKAQKYDQL